MVHVRDKNLPQRLVDIVGELEQNAGDADCVKLLLCKSAPFVWGMQRAIAERIDGVEEDSEEDEDEKAGQGGNRIEAFFKYLPEMKEFRHHGDGCNERYNSCAVLGAA